MHCKVPILLANILLAYLGASVLYLFASRFMGTPFTDSLTLEQMRIKKKSSKTRMLLFVGAYVLIVTVLVIKPVFPQVVGSLSTT